MSSPAPIRKASGPDNLVISDDCLHPANVICELCRLFYDKDWVTGTGGGMSIKEGDLVYLAPSGVQKERMQPKDLFVMSSKTGEYLKTPDTYKPSACTPLFGAIYKSAEQGKHIKANACIHTHSQAAVMVSLLYGNEFRISNIEQIKAIPKITEPGYLDNTDELIIPIIENTLQEENLTPTLTAVLEKYPQACAVIVRRHGIFVWGENVWKAKIINEAIDYLLELAIKMRSFNIPTTGPLGVEKQSQFHTCQEK